MGKSKYDQKEPPAPPLFPVTAGKSQWCYLCGEVHDYHPPMETTPPVVSASVGDEADIAPRGVVDIQRYH